MLQGPKPQGCWGDDSEVVCVPRLHQTHPHTVEIQFFQFRSVFHRLCNGQSGISFDFTEGQVQLLQQGKGSNIPSISSRRFSHN